MKLLIISAAAMLITSQASADIQYLESGFGITFQGCEYDKIINLKNGFAWECSEYGYTYHYGELTVLDINGTSKLCVGDVEEAIEEYPDGDCYDGTLYQWN